MSETSIKTLAKSATIVGVWGFSALACVRLPGMFIIAGPMALFATMWIVELFD